MPLARAQTAVSSFPSSQGGALYYDFVAYNSTTETVPDVQVKLKSSGGVDVALYLYCNPAWFSASAPENSVPRPTNAIFKSGAPCLCYAPVIHPLAVLAHKSKLRNAKQ